MAERKAPATRDDFVAYRSIQTRWMDNDVYGHLNNVVHYSLFDTAVNGWLIEQGLLDPRRGDTIGLVVQTGCVYHSEIMFPDTVQAGLKVTHVGTSSVRYEIGLFRNDEETAAAEGFFVHVYVAKGTRSPVPLSDAHRRSLRGLMT